jgi:aerobic C4-dicarboxylate transport protein
MEAEPSVRPAGARSRRPWYRRLQLWILAGAVGGAATGLVAPGFGRALAPLGEIFVSLLTMTLGPIVFCMVVAGIGAVANLRQVGRVALRSIVYFEVITTIALLLGLAVVNLVRPGAGLHISPASLVVSEDAAEKVDAAQPLSAFDHLTHAIPSNIVASFADGAILQILVFAVLFGVALAVLGERGRPITRGIERLSEVLFTVVRFVTYVAPIGVFGAMAYTLGSFGAATIGGLAKLVATFYATSIVFVVVVFGGVLLIGRLNPLRVFAYFKDEVVLALGASSSEVAVPGIIRKLENVGVSKGTAGISVGAGYSFNLDGTCLYLTLASMFIAQALDLRLDLGQQLALLLVMLLSSKGSAGVSGGGFVQLTATISSFSLIPVSGVMLVFGVDRFMSECRAVVNSLGNAIAGLVIARFEGEISPAEVMRIMTGEAPGHVRELDRTTTTNDVEQTHRLAPEPVGAGAGANRSEEGVK